MTCNSEIYTANTTPQALLGGAQVPFGQIVRRYGRFINLEGQNIVCCEPGYYDVDCNLTLEPTAIGPVSAQLYVNGEPYPGAIQTGYATAAGNPVPLSFHPSVRVRKCCCGDGAVTLAVVLGEEGATVTNMGFRAKKN